MSSPAKRFVFGLLIMLLAVTGILIKFDKMPGVNLSGGSFKLDPGSDKDGPAKADSRDELRLCGLSGTPVRRLAIVNNQTLAVGETARVEWRGEKVKVRLQEIRPRSVLVQVDGAREPVELFLEEAKVESAETTAPRGSIAGPRKPPAAPAARVALDAGQSGVAATEILTNAVLQIDVSSGTAEILVDGTRVQITK